jgi:hypothetical protein
MAADAAAWVRALAARLGVPPPSDEETEALLAVAGTAAHASERVAAPLSCWLVGRAGVDPTEVKSVAAELAAELAGTGPSEETCT